MSKQHSLDHNAKVCISGHNAGIGEGLRPFEPWINWNAPHLNLLERDVVLNTSTQLLVTVT